MAQADTGRLPYKVKDLSLAEWGRKEIKIAEQNTPEGNQKFEKLKNEVSTEMDKMPDLSGPDTPLSKLEKSFAGGHTF